MKVALAKLKRSKRPIRPVLEETVEFCELMDSMSFHGQLVPLVVSGDRIVDGHRRYKAAERLGWDELEVTVRDDMTDLGVLVAQITLNKLHNTEYKSAILRLVKDFQLDKLEIVAHTLNRHIDWVAHILGLDNLSKTVRLAVDQNVLDVQSAVLLAKLGKRKQLDIFTTILDLTSEARIDHIRREVRLSYEGKLDRRMAKLSSADTAILRSERALVKELSSPTEAMRVLTLNDAESALDGWKLALRWALQIDPGSIEARKYVLELSE